MKLPSIFSILKVGIGPSSSHTLGALKIGQKIRKYIINKNIKIKSITIKLMGSFAHTGKGHLTHKAAVAGLNGYKLKDIDKTINEIYEVVEKENILKINSTNINFIPDKNIIYDKKTTEIPHPNTIEFELLFNDNSIENIVYCSIGAGDIKKTENLNENNSVENKKYSFEDIFKYCDSNNIDLIQLIENNEKKYHSIRKNELYNRLNKIWQIMQQNIENGLNNSGVLPGSLELKRRAKEMYEAFLENLRNWRLLSRQITLANIYAISVAEENASGEIIITAPTCGSAGILPSALKIMEERYHLTKNKVISWLMIAGLIGAVIKKNGSVSGAEVGCQGEVGVASSMAAGAICYLLNGNLKQIQNASEIALEHHLGLPCDPIDGLVQIPCIERNGVGVITSLNAANLALMRKSEQQISLDQVVDVMMEIGNDMNKKYKETALGGLAKKFKK